jgi:integrase/recombinase XerD
MVLAMLLGALRRCEVLGLQLGDVSVGERGVHITSGKGGRERIVPVSGRFFAALGECLEHERPADSTTETCFVVLKGPQRGLPLSAAGLDEVLDGARGRAGLSRCTCHQLRHTCLTRLREQGMALEAGAGAGRACVDRVYAYLSASRERLA